MSLVERFKAVHIIDSTTLNLPDELASEWSGCGGQAASGTALKVSVDWDMRQGTLHGLYLSVGRVHDQRSPVAAGHYEAGMLRLADSGYFNLSTLQHMAEQGVYWITRLKSKVRLFSPHGHPLAWADLLRQTSADQLEREVLVGTQRLPARWCAQRLAPQAAACRHAQLKERERKKQRPVSADTRSLASWTVCITNVPSDLLSFDQVMVMVRVRWQIEVLFKIWKSQTFVDEWRTAQPWRTLCEIYAKLLALLLQHWLVIVGTWALPNRSLHLTFRVLRKHAWHLAATLSEPSAFHCALNAIRRTLSLCTMTALHHQPHTFQRLAQAALYA